MHSYFTLHSFAIILKKIKNPQADHSTIIVCNHCKHRRNILNFKFQSRFQIQNCQGQSHRKIARQRHLTVRFQGLSGSGHRRSKRTPVGIYLKKNTKHQANIILHLPIQERMSFTCNKCSSQQVFIDASQYISKHMLDESGIPTTQKQRCLGFVSCAYCPQANINNIPLGVVY